MPLTLVTNSPVDDPNADTLNEAFTKTNDNDEYLDDRIDGKQDTLVSATNIKTINSESLLGSGNITVAASKVAGEILQVLFLKSSSTRVTNGTDLAIAIDPVSDDSTFLIEYKGSTYVNTNNESIKVFAQVDSVDVDAKEMARSQTPNAIGIYTSMYGLDVYTNSSLTQKTVQVRVLIAVTPASTGPSILKVTEVKN